MEKKPLIHFTVLTLFADLIKSYVGTSILDKAINKAIIKVDVVDIRSFSSLKHHQVDDYQYGGSEGIVLMVEPIVKAIASVKTKDSLIVLLSPQGKQFNQQIAYEFSKKYQHIILICGHYEGFDERVRNYIDLELSIGDYVLTSGELASMVVIDAISRLVPNVIKTQSHLNDSFTNNLLDHPVYTKPVDFNGLKVPEVLLSGHHANIKLFREKEALRNTYIKRKDLLEQVELTQQQIDWINEFKTNKE